MSDQTIYSTFVPKLNEKYIPWGHHNDIKRLLDTNDFVTIFVTGLSGNGKTMMIEQIAAELGRKLLRCNIIETTDEDDLICSLRLKDGNTIIQPGAALCAMKEEAILLLDEIDLGSERLMCLQSILEGNGVFVKKQNEWVEPKKKFQIVATGNTKGRGSESGKFIGTNILNEAFLDRFEFTFEQPYPPPEIEKQILLNHQPSANSEFVDHLTNWANLIRITYYEGGFDEVVGTRRLISILKSYNTFKSKEKAIEMCLSRFDEKVKYAFISLYKKIDESDN